VAQTLGAKIAAIARREARPPPGTAFLNKDGGKGYCHSSDGNKGHPELWCADFVKHVWHKAGALNTETLNAAASSFVHYGRLRRKPRVGDAVVFGYDRNLDRANHVAIVVWVHRDGRITTVGGDENGVPNEGDIKFASTSSVCKDGPYSVSGTQNPGISLISGFVSPVEDDMPFTDKQIVDLVKKGVRQEMKADTATRKAITDLVKQGVAAELKTPIGTTGITPAQGAQAAVQVQAALDVLSKQVADLTALVKALPTAAPAPAGTPPGPQPPDGTTTPTRTPPGTRKPTSTRTPTRTAAAPSGGRG
jgi:hypothetical protein